MLGLQPGTSGPAPPPPPTPPSGLNPRTKNGTQKNNILFGFSLYAKVNFLKLCPCSPLTLHCITTVMRIRRRVRPFLLMWAWKSYKTVGKFFFHLKNHHTSWNRARTRPVGLSARHPLSQSENESKATTQFIWHLGGFDGTILPFTSSKLKLTTF